MSVWNLRLGRPRWDGFAVVAAIVAGGCSATTGSGSAHTPAVEVEPGAGEPVAHQVASVSIEAAADWEGDPEVLQHVTPVEVIVENHRSEPLAVVYENFELLTGRERHEAIPPFQIDGRIDGKVEQMMTVRPTLPVDNPAFDSNDFYVYPHYGPLYPGMATFPFAHRSDLKYYRHYYTYWKESALPTAEMLREALPEGVVESGGRVRGHLFFERAELEGSEARGFLKVDLVAVGGSPLGVARIPLRGR